MNRLFRHLFPFFLLFIGLASSVTSQGLPTAAPEEVGLSTQRLSRIDAFMQSAVEQNQIAGAVTMVVRKGKVAHFKNHGMQDIENQRPMRTDTIFRIASMSKAITSVAVMMLYEEGHFLLDDPVSELIPEFKNPRVLISDSSERTGSLGYTLVPANKEITIRHLLNHTSGIPYAIFAGGHIAKLHKEAGVDKGIGLSQMEGTIGQMVKKLAGLPLVHHPGEAWTYGMSIDVLGYVVEVVSEMPLDEFFRTRIFQPLRMVDTGFYLPSDQVSRLSAVYKPQQKGRLIRYEEKPEGKFSQSITPIMDPEATFQEGAASARRLRTTPDSVKCCSMAVNSMEVDCSAPRPSN